MTHDKDLVRKHLKEIDYEVRHENHLNHNHNKDNSSVDSSNSSRSSSVGGLLSKRNMVMGSVNSMRTSSSSSSAASMPQVPQVKLDDFDILKVLGKGAYGKVYQVRKNNGCDSNRIFAMKAVNKSRIMDSRTDMRHTRTEREVLAKVEHPFLIKMYYAFETPKRLYFVQEFCRGGELFRLMEIERMFLEEHARFYLCEIVCALEYLHSLDIVYRDLKTENIMLDASGHIKLIDFGLSKMLESSDQLTSTFCGTVEYMAPEVVLKSPGHGKAADWWSFGIFMYDLLTGRSPFHSVKGKKETKERILRGKFTIPNFISASGTDLLRKLIRRNVTRRLGSSSRGAKDVKEHHFFTGVDWKKVLKREYVPPHVPQLDHPEDPTDISQFDPRFTNRPPRETDDNDKKLAGDLENQYDEEELANRKKNIVMFGDFDFVSPECLEGMVEFDDDEEEEEDDDDKSFVSHSQIELDMHGLYIRCHGD